MERIIPDEASSGSTTGADTLALHLDRYRFAVNNLLPGTVLDMACGVGGSHLLAESPITTKVTGVDLDLDAIEYARGRYSHPKLEFIAQTRCVSQRAVSSTISSRSKRLNTFPFPPCSCVI